MKHRTVNDYFKQQWPRLSLFAAFTLGVSFFAPLKNFQLKWLIDSKSKQEALGYMGLVFAITFSSWFFERLSRRSFTRIACGAVEQVRQRILEQVLYRTVAQYNADADEAYLSLLTTDLHTLYDDKTGYTGAAVVDGSLKLRAVLAGLGKGEGTVGYSPLLQKSSPPPQ